MAVALCGERREGEDVIAEILLGVMAPSKHSCGSTDDLVAQLRGVLSGKVTEKRADHVSDAFELRATTQFTLMVSESENDAIERLANIDPSLGEVPCSAARRGDSNGQMTRAVRANDTILNQPSENPVLQWAVVKHIIGAVSATDGSDWIVREVSRAPQGWTFTCHCKESLAAWNQHSGENLARPVIGEFSNASDDTINLSELAPGAERRLSANHLQVAQHLIAEGP